MDTIIGLGGVGCRLAREFEEFEEYKVFKIDTEDSEEKNYLKIIERQHPEEYERDPPKVKSFLKSISGDILFVVCGASVVSAASLVILQQIHGKCNVNILYIKPEMTLMSETRSLQENTAFNVLQQYTRSGVFERLYLVSNEQVDPLVTDASILGYYKSINEMVVHAFHMINVFEHTAAITSTFSNPAEVSRIVSFGLLNVTNGSEKIFFPLDSLRETRYYYGIPETKLKKEKKLHRKIINQVKKKTDSDSKVSFGIYSTSYQQDCGYILAFSSKVQETS